MKTIVVSFLMTALAVPAGAAESAGVEGKWSVSASIAGNDSQSVCTFIQKDSTLSGNCDGRTGMVAIRGRVEDKNVSWSFKSQYDGAPLTVSYAGTVEVVNGTPRITGSVEVPEFGVTGTFTAAPVK